jgi:hypothetical protein
MFKFQKQAKFHVTDTLTSTKRVWVNCTTSMLYDVRDTSEKLKTQFYALDCISCWGGRDQVDEQCADGSLTSSWEIPAEFVPAMNHMLLKFQWEESNFFLKADKH